jgi:hypothetical protein
MPVADLTMRSSSSSSLKSLNSSNRNLKYSKDGARCDAASASTEASDAGSRIICCAWTSKIIEYP